MLKTRGPQPLVHGAFTTGPLGSTYWEKTIAICDLFFYDVNLITYTGIVYVTERVNLRS